MEVLVSFCLCVEHLCPAPGQAAERSAGGDSHQPVDFSRAAVGSANETCERAAVVFPSVRSRSLKLESECVPIRLRPPRLAGEDPATTLFNLREAPAVSPLKIIKSRMLWFQSWLWPYEGCRYGTDLAGGVIWHATAVFMQHNCETQQSSVAGTGTCYGYLDRPDPLGN